MRGYGNYDKFPSVKTEKTALKGYDALRGIIENSREKTVVIDCYPLVDCSAVVREIGDLFDKVIYSDECAYSGKELTDRMSKWLTDDRVFGVLTTDYLEDYFIGEKVQKASEEIKKSDKRVLIIGVGAMLICDKGLVFYASVTRWESQLRFRKGVPNWNCDNYDEDNLTKFKRGYFCEWRLADKHKIRNINKADYIIDADDTQSPVIFTCKDYFYAMEKAVNMPFRVVPYFDPGVWGGQWMKEVCGLDKNADNFAWCFDCVPEENSMYYDFCGIRAEMPAVDLVFFYAKKLLGERVQARFGNEFPIRFDFLDTMGGGNLSLQVHPTTEYIQEVFNMRYTQDESYYMLDCEEDGCVYLGVKKGVDKKEFVDALNNAQISGNFDAEKYVNCWKAKKHDHFLIPAGTIHCSGKNSMVLEISSTPYIFTFKLWDWGRLGLDGKPRPINIGHGGNVIDFARDTEWTKNNLIAQNQVILNGEGYTEERTGLHEREFLETRRHFFTKEVLHKANGSVCVLNLVEGEEAQVCSPDGRFAPFTVHYAETFIVPASVGDFIVRPTEKTAGKKLATIKAYVRG